MFTRLEIVNKEETFVHKKSLSEHCEGPRGASTHAFDLSCAGSVNRAQAQTMFQLFAQHNSQKSIEGQRETLEL
jgi:hypothetical protein